MTHHYLHNTCAPGSHESDCARLNAHDRTLWCEACREDTIKRSRGRPWTGPC